MEKKIEIPFTNTDPVMFSKKTTILFVACLIIGFIVIVQFSQNQQEKLNAKYPLLKKETEVNGTVKHILFQKSIFITLNHNIYIEVRFLENTQYEHYDFRNFVQINDSLSKRADSDTLYVFRKGRKYFFAATPPYYSGWE